MTSRPEVAKRDHHWRNPVRRGVEPQLVIPHRGVELQTRERGVVQTRDVSKAHRLAKGIRAGSVWVNCYQAMDPAVPFGGYKMSGYGRESGLQQLEEYLNVKAVWIKTA